jgi:FlaA1/EpsC-like NDP-sugar epimerase
MESKIKLVLLSFPRPLKRLLVAIADIACAALATWIAFFLRLGVSIPIFDFDVDYTIIFWKTVLGSLIILVPVFSYFGLYRVIFRYSGWPFLITLLKAIIIYGSLYILLFVIIEVDGVPRRIGLIQPLMFFLLVALTRLLISEYLGRSYRDRLAMRTLPKVLIYGAGEAGRQIARVLKNNSQMHPVGFIDDDKRLWGNTILGLKIYSPNNLNNLLPSLEVSTILLAIPSVDFRRRTQIINELSKLGIAIRTLPNLTDLAVGRAVIGEINELDIQDFLGREMVSPDINLLNKNVSKKIVLVTGAGGSIGSELCRQIAKLNPAKLIMVDHSEFALYKIAEELEKNTQIQALSILGSVTDRSAMNVLLYSYKPETIFHAAAYKHVPLVENNIVQGVKNNVFGTVVVAELAIKHDVKNFVLISTDKAVRPSSIMGATKRIAEMYLQAMAENMNESNKINFSIVRFGNVLDSSGSVVPKFRQQIMNGGPITLTHKETTRFFMTIPEAAQLVIQASALGVGGEIFILDMGQPIKIMDLAKRMVNLSGLRSYDANTKGVVHAGDIEIQVIGLRAGEKIHEELVIGGKIKGTSHPRVSMAYEGYIPWDRLSKKLNLLELQTNQESVSGVKKVLLEIINDKEVVICCND